MLSSSVERDTLTKVGVSSQEPEVNHYLTPGFYLLYFPSTLLSRLKELAGKNHPNEPFAKLSARPEINFGLIVESPLKRTRSQFSGSSVRFNGLRSVSPVA